MKEKLWEIDIFSIKKKFEEVRVTHGESEVTHGENILWTKTYIIYDVVFTCMSWNSLYEQATYQLLTLRRKNADPNKGVAFR